MSGPRLLDKKTVNAEVATQRKEQIDSGLVIAKKIDALRETLSEEERNLEVFRTETIKQVQKEIDEKIKDRDIIHRANVLFQERMNAQEEAAKEREAELNQKEEYLNGRYRLLEEIINEVD